MQIGSYIEGRQDDLETLVKHISAQATGDQEAVQNAVKNVIFTEATRRSYSHDKRALQHLCLIHVVPISRRPQFRVLDNIVAVNRSHLSALGTMESTSVPAFF